MEGLGRGRERAVNRASGISSQDFSSFQENYIWKEYIKMMLEPQEKAAWTKWHKNLVTDQKEKKKVLQEPTLYIPVKHTINI